MLKNLFGPSPFNRPSPFKSAVVVDVDVPRTWRPSPSPSGNIFADQARFMAMAGQKPGMETFKLYRKLIDEELRELDEAIEAGDEVKIFDALCDLHVVVAGAGIAKRLPMQAGMNETFSSNFSKFDSNGKPWAVREDGKVLKDEHFREADFARVMMESDQNPVPPHPYSNHLAQLAVAQRAASAY